MNLPEIRQYLSNLLFPKKDLEKNVNDILSLYFFSPDKEPISVSESIKIKNDSDAKFNEKLTQIYNSNLNDNLEIEKHFRSVGKTLKIESNRIDSKLLDFSDYTLEFDFIQKIAK